MEIVHHRVTTGGVDEEMAARCAEDFARAAGELIESLAEREWLVGETMTAADISAAAVMYRVRSAHIFAMPEGEAAIDDWIDRVMSYDRYLQN